ncbi:MAG: hypothetical protein Q9216_006320 [Gyalolechia sp. 2 TL-2023]
MDIRSLIDSDASGSTPRVPPTAPESRREPIQQFNSPQNIHQEIRDHAQRFTQRGSGIEPPQPPPLRPPPHNEFRSPSASSYNSVQSPYQKTPSSALSTGQYPFPQPPSHHSTYGTNYYQHDGQTFAVNTAHQGHNQAASLPQTPTSSTPGSSYPSFQQHRPLSSHSASTPTSGHAQTPIFFRDSPQQSHAQIRGTYVSNQHQQLLSQPGTPLGPPTTLGRQSLSIRRESPGSYEHKRTNSGGSHGRHQPSIHSPNSTVRSHPGPSPSVYAPMRVQSPSQQNDLMSQDRERSLSVSPKTRIPSQPYLNTKTTTLDLDRTPGSQVTPAKRKMGDSRTDEASLEQQPSAKRSMSLGVEGMLNASDQDESSAQSREKFNKHPQVPLQRETPNLHGERSSAGDSDRFRLTAPGHEAAASSLPTTTQQSLRNPLPTEDQTPSGVIVTKRLVHESHHPVGPANHKNVPVMHSSSFSARSDGQSQRPKSGQGTTSQMNASNPLKTAPKRTERYREVPIFAQSARQKGRSGTQINGERHTIGRNPALVQQQPANDVLHPQIRQDTNGHGVPRIDTVQSELDPAGMLGEWEPSINNVIPAEELTREIMDYLYATVVQMNGVTFGPAGGSTSSRGAVVEIEAKIGQIIDKNTNDRLRLPVMTECLLSRTDPNLRTAFRSSMTAAQHSRLNGFLNFALQKSVAPAPSGEAPKKSRVPLTYVHTRETDTFYDLSQNAINVLPPSVQAYLDRRNKPKVRITTDQKTGKEMAKIIKVRISDIEIYSPQTPFDWRVSVSLEVNYEGDMRELVETTEGKERRNPDRNKDRVSYKHSHYQIDLTQVKAAGANSNVEKEHELEVEISSAAVREQGQLVAQGQPNKYEELIKGFVDNVRTLMFPHISYSDIVLLAELTSRTLARLRNASGEDHGLTGCVSNLLIALRKLQERAAESGDPVNTYFIRQDRASLVGGCWRVVNDLDIALERPYGPTNAESIGDLIHDYTLAIHHFLVTTSSKNYDGTAPYLGLSGGPLNALGPAMNRLIPALIARAISENLSPCSYVRDNKRVLAELKATMPDVEIEKQRTGVHAYLRDLWSDSTQRATAGTGDATGNEDFPWRRTGGFGFTCSDPQTLFESFCGKGGTSQSKQEDDSPSATGLKAEEADGELRRIEETLKDYQAEYEDFVNQTPHDRRVREKKAQALLERLEENVIQELDQILLGSGNPKQKTVKKSLTLRAQAMQTKIDESRNKVRKRSGPF